MRSTPRPDRRPSPCLLLLLALLCLPLEARAETCAYTAGAARVAVPDRPFGVKASADGCWLFVSLIGTPEAGGAIVVLRNTSGAFHVVHVAHVKGQPGGMSLSHDGRRLAAAAQDRTLLLDVGKLEQGAADPVVGEVPEGAGAGAVYAQFTRDDRRLFVSEERGDRLAVIDVARALSADGEKAVLNRVVVGRGPVGLALSADGARLYSTSEIAPPSAKWPAQCGPQRGGRGARQPNGMLLVVDVAAAASEATKSVVAVAAAGCGPVRVALSPDGATAWVTARGDNDLLAFPTARLSGVQLNPKLEQRRVGTAPVGVAVRPDAAEVWVANSDRFSPSGAGSLMGVATAGGGARKEASGRFPRELAFLPDGRTLVATVFGSSELQFVPTGAPGEARRP